MHPPVAPGVSFPQVTPQKYLDLAVDACNASVEQLLVAHPGAVTKDCSDQAAARARAGRRHETRSSTLALFRGGIGAGEGPQDPRIGYGRSKLGFWLRHCVQSLFQRMSRVTQPPLTLQVVISVTPSPCSPWALA